MKRILFPLAAAISGFGSFAQIPAWLPKTGLVAWYPFNGNANDQSGSGSHGTLHDAVLTTDRTGSANSAYQFNGSTAHIIGSCDKFPKVARSVSLWFIGTNIGVGVRGRSLWGYGGSDCGQSYLMYLNMPIAPNSYETSGHCDANLVTYGYGANHPNNAWHSWIISSDTSGTKFYIDGKLVATSTTYSSNTVVAGKNFIIGCVPKETGVGNSFGDECHAPFQGKLDDVAVYNRALSACEARQIYDAKKITATPPATKTFAIGATASFSVATADTCVSFQWQQSTGAGFTNLPNTGIYSGVTTPTLTIRPVASTMNNHRYRCIISSCLYCPNTSAYATLRVGIQKGKLVKD